MPKITKETKIQHQIRATDEQWKNITSDCALIKAKMRLETSDAIETALKYFTAPLKTNNDKADK